MNNNDQLSSIFRGGAPEASLGEDFEDRVFAKIKKKKKQRKVIASSLFVAIFVAGLFFVYNTMTSVKPPVEDRIIVQSESIQKEEIPLMEDVIFASSDAKTDYSIEQVGYFSDRDAL